MKTFKYFSMMLAMLVCCMGFISCDSDDDDNNANSIYGTWSQTNGNGVFTLTFKSNGTGTYINTTSGETRTGAFEFDYDASNRTITIVSKTEWAQVWITGDWYVTITPSTLLLRKSTYYYEFKRV